MRVKFRRWEIVLYTMLVALGLAIALPRFFRNQISQDDNRIMHDLESAVSALKSYSDDHPVIRRSLTSFRDHLLRADWDKTLNAYEGGNYRGVSETMTQQYEYGQINFRIEGRATLRGRGFDVLIQILHHKGYVGDHSQLQFFDRNNGMMFYVLGEHFHEEEKSADSQINWGFAVPWPHTLEERTGAYFSDEMKQGGLFHGLGTSMLRDDFYYSPSNGLHSFGFVYCDMLGNRSPIE